MAEPTSPAGSEGAPEPGVGTDLDFNYFNPDVLLAVDDDLVCGICRNVIQSACQPSNGDSHIFCRECLLQSLAAKGSCPACNVAATKETMTNVAFIDRRINNLRAKCYAQNAGCTWQGPFLDLREQHWPEDCSYHGQPCALCEEIVPAGDRKRHIATICPKKRLQCVLCKSFVLRETTPDHLANVCPESELDCPNDCGAAVLRRELAYHLARDCPEALLPCFTAGCDQVVKRKDMDTHLASNMTRHLTLAIRDLQRLKDMEELREIRTLAEELKGMKGTIKKVESSVYGPRPVVMLDMSGDEFDDLRDMYAPGLSLDKEFTAFGIDWKAHVYPSGHEGYEEYISAFVGPMVASLPERWEELRYKCLFELFADGVSVSHRVDDRITNPPRPGRYGWFKFAEYSAVKDAAHVQFVVSLLHANLILPAPGEDDDADAPSPERMPETKAGMSLYVVANVLLLVGLIAIFSSRRS